MHYNKILPYLYFCKATDGTVQSLMLTNSCFLKTTLIGLIHRQKGTRLTDSFSQTTWVSWHLKGKTILNFNEATNDGVSVASAGPYANRLQFTVRVYLF